jgi:hypothetical protein
VSGAVNERIYTLLVQIESLGFVRHCLDVVNVNESVQRTAHNVVQIRVVLDFGDPALMDPAALLIDALYHTSHLYRLDLLFLLSRCRFLFLLNF